jgi:hypothetical protein
MSMTREQALEHLAGRFSTLAAEPVRPDIVSWAHDRYYLAPGSSTESSLRFSVPIRLMPHQQTILRLMFHHPHLKFTTMLFSTVKKSGKTAIGGLVARYLAETSGYYAEIYCLANDEEQARGRIYKAAVDSIENTPDYDEYKHVLPMTGTRKQLVDQMHGPRAAQATNEWRIIERQAEYVPTKSFMRALSSDYRGEAGANPSATVWSEIWGLDSEKSKKLWAELTPVPTRSSIRFVETYAGYEGESHILEEVWETAKKGHQLTRSELQHLTFKSVALATEEIMQGVDRPSLLNYQWPVDQPGYRGHDELLPLWINEEASMIAYIDQGVQARRMPWQQGDRGTAYYKEQEHAPGMDALQMRRFHENEWTSTVSPFIDINWWYGCSIREIDPASSAIGSPRWLSNLREGFSLLSPLVRRTGVVIGIDAATSSDYMSACVFTRESMDTVALRMCKVWRPEDQPSGKFDYEETIVPFVKWCCRHLNVKETCYDPTQMHKVATDLERDYICTCFSFEQGASRLKADKQLHDLIRDREIMYDPLDPSLVELSVNYAQEVHNDWVYKS